MHFKKLKKRLFIALTAMISSSLLLGCNNDENLENNLNEETEEILIDEEYEAAKRRLIIELAKDSYVEGETPLMIEGIVLVNKEYGIPSDFATGLDEEMLKQFELMKADAKSDGLDINIRSGYRTQETQETLFNNYVAKDGLEEAMRYSAVPGFSEHQTGLAIDISNGDSQTSIGDWFTETPQATWLYENAWKYGFILRYPEGKENITGYKYESWHYRYVGVAHSENFNQNDLTLEEYLGIYTNNTDENA
jgi:D-alanyl-D-alanine carboxypeptidase